RRLAERSRAPERAGGATARDRRRRPDDGGAADRRRTQRLDPRLRGAGALWPRWHGQPAAVVLACGRAWRTRGARTGVPTGRSRAVLPAATRRGPVAEPQRPGTDGARDAAPARPPRRPFGADRRDHRGRAGTRRRAVARDARAAAAPRRADGGG